MTLQQSLLPTWTENSQRIAFIKLSKRSVSKKTIELMEKCKLAFPILQACKLRGNDWSFMRKKGASLPACTKESGGGGRRNVRSREKLDSLSLSLSLPPLLPIRCKLASLHIFPSRLEGFPERNASLHFAFCKLASNAARQEG